MTASLTRPVRKIPVGPKLRNLLGLVFALLALLGVNSVYLATISMAEWLAQQRGEAVIYQNYFYQWMFLIHLLLGLLLVTPFVLFGAIHWSNARRHPNRRAAAVGYGLLAMAIIVLVTGLLLTRVEIFGASFNVADGSARGALYWLHVLGPLAAVWLYVLHRLVGRRLRWRAGLGWATLAAAFAAVMLLLHRQDPTEWNVIGPASSEVYFSPSLARTGDGNFIDADLLMMDDYCQRCHPDAHEAWSHSMHRFSSFNNPAYLLSVRNTRRKLQDRDGSVHASRFCAGCHDPVPFFSGAFDDPRFDDPEYDLSSDPLAEAGITCTSCHAITNINSPRGNADFTIEAPVHYPFARSENRFLQWVNEQLIKANPAFHKQTFLKPLHKTAEFCGSCHKVHLPEALNAYKFLRGQNHYDSFRLSGVSGHGVGSFYYPPQAQQNCNGCHMPLQTSDDFAAADFGRDGRRTIHDHQFPSANTAIPHLLGMPPEVNEAHADFLDDIVRLDFFALRENGRIDGRLIGPVRPGLPELEPGQTYLVELVIRTTGLGHLLTQGTADSNQLWIECTATADGRVIGKSGGVRADSREIDPWSHFVNAFVLDRDGNRIDRRNPEDIFIPLYNNQIPPGAADVVHYRLVVPPDAREIELCAALHYRKFDTNYLRLFMNDPDRVNDLPIVTMALDRITLPVRGTTPSISTQTSPIPEWQRWNDYGIGLLRKGHSAGGGGQLRQAEQAFEMVESSGRFDGPLNLARVYLAEGRVDEAAEALARAVTTDASFPWWTHAWIASQVNRQNGLLEEARTNLRFVSGLSVAPELKARGFDFTKDDRVFLALGEVCLELARQSVDESYRMTMLRESRQWLEHVLRLDPEHVAGHHNLAAVLELLGEDQAAAEHRRLHELYKPDDNARDRAISMARERYPAAAHAANDVAIYDLHRPEAFLAPVEPTHDRSAHE